MSRLSLDVSEKFHLKLKMLTTWKGISIKDFVIQTLNKQIELEYTPNISSKILNEETLKIVKESHQGINVNSYESKKEFLKHLDKLAREVKQELAEENRVNNTRPK